MYSLSNGFRATRGGRYQRMKGNVARRYGLDAREGVEVFVVYTVDLIKGDVLLVAKAVPWYGINGFDKRWRSALYGLRRGPRH